MDGFEKALLWVALVTVFIVSTCSLHDDCAKVKCPDGQHGAAVEGLFTYECTCVVNR